MTPEQLRDSVKVYYSMYIYLNDKSYMLVFLYKNKSSSKSHQNFLAYICTISELQNPLNKYMVTFIFKYQLKDYFFF